LDDDDEEEPYLPKRICGNLLSDFNFENDDGKNEPAKENFLKE